MQPRLRQTLLHRLILIEDMPKILYRSRNDTTPARRTDDIIQSPVLDILDDSRGDGGQRSLTRFDEISGRGFVAESVSLIGDGEVVHFVVHDDACFGDDELAAEE